ncbi:MAG: hypothetical protein IKE60_06185 [Reyranella sp.]|uniref:DUF6180 family protein n=1 Tax=Reyranella sp. TaxID=1929291 RepID=UPI000B1EAE52|nr:DUF6180 family protein [Reyranella sp.]MBR2814219.1 hypothetical protein [Reyranella sp.]
MRMLIASTALVFGFATGLAPRLTQAAPDTFNVAFNVERIDAAKLSIDRCAEIAQQEAGDQGYSYSVNRTPGKLMVVSGGPAQGGASLLVYCIAVDNKTAYVVQGIDYQRQKGSAGRLADRIHKALLEASK